MKISSDITAIVTGGASGLGEATARGLAAKGAKVGIFDMNEERGQMVAKEIGGVFANVNVADNASVDAGFETVRAANGQERIMVNCAGIGAAMKTVARKRDSGAIIPHDVEAYIRVINIHLKVLTLIMSAELLSTRPQWPRKTGKSGKSPIVLPKAEFWQWRSLWRAILRVKAFA